MAVTRINNNQITDASAGNVYLGINANTKLQNYSITSNKIANNLTYGSDLTVTGNLTVQGSSTAIDTTITTIEDPVIVLASTQTGSPTVDIGFLGERGTANNIAFVWNEANSEFVTAFTSTSETSTTISILAYADLHTNNMVVGGTTSLSGNIIGAVNATDTITGGNLATAGTVSATGNVTGGNIATGGTVSATGTITSADTITGGNIATGGTVSATGNITAGAASFFIGNGSQLTGVTASSANAETLTGTFLAPNVLASSLTSVGNLTNLSVVGTTTSGNVDTAGTVSATGTVTGGNIATGGTVSATGTATAGNLATGGTVSATGNVIGGNFNTGGLISATGDVTGGNVLTGGLISATGAVTAGSLETSGTANVTGTITGGNISTGGFVSAVGTATVGNLATAGTASATGTVTGGNIATGGTVSATGDITGGNLATGGTASATGNVTGGNIDTGGTVSATGNISGSYFLGNGRQLTGITAESANAETLTGTFLAPNVLTSSLTAVGDLTSLSVVGTTQSGNLQTAGIMSAGGNVTGANLLTAGLVSAGGNVTGANILTGGIISATGNITGGNVDAAQVYGSTTLTLRAGTGNINLETVGNIVLANTIINGLAQPLENQDAATKLYVDTIATTGITIHEQVLATTVTDLATATGGTISYAQPNGVSNGVGAYIQTTGTFTTIDTANVQTVGTRILVKNEANAVLNGVYVYSNATSITRSTDADEYGAQQPESFSVNDYFFTSGGNVNSGAAFVVSEPTGTITFGTSNITFAQFSSSQVYSANTAAGLSLIGTVFSAKVDNDTTAFDGLGNISVKAGANLTTPNIGAATGTSLSTTGTITGGNIATGGTVSATGTATAGNIATGGTVSATSTITGGNIATAGTVSATGNITGDYFIGNGRQLTGVTAESANAETLTGTFLATNVVNSSLITVGALTSLSVVGTTQTGNLDTAGTVSATGTITGGNVATSGTVSATGTATLGNVATGGTVSATGTITGGNVDTSGTVSAGGNVTGANLVTGGLVTSTGNVTGGNILTGGLISSTGTVTGGNLITSGILSSTGTATVGNVNTGGTVSATGTITGGNIDTGGTVSATGNITAGAASFFIGNGSQLTGVTASSANAETLTGTFLAPNVLDSSLITVGNLTSLSVVGTTQSGNLQTAGLISATGTITGGNVDTGGTVSATATITGGNLATGGTASASGNITGGNIATAGELQGGNIVISGDDITDTNGRVNFNTAGADVDFAVNGDTVANVFYVDAGVGTASFGSATQTINSIVSFNATNSILMPVGNTAQRPAGTTGQFRFNTTLNTLEIYDNASWVSVGQPDFTLITDEQFNGDGSTVVFTLSGNATTAGSIVSINGVQQIPTTAYAVSGTTLTFTEAPETGDLIDVRVLTTTTSVYSISNSNSTAVVAVQDGSNVVAVTGDLSVSGTIIGGNINSTAITFGTSNMTVVSSGGNIRANVGGTTVQTISPGLVAITGDLSVTGNATLSGNILGDRIQNGTTSFDIQTPSGNANITVGGTSNVAVFSPTVVTMAANLIPTANVTYDLGTTTNRWKDIWLSNSTIYMGNAQISANATSLIFTSPAGGQTVFAGATGGDLSVSNIINSNANGVGNIGSSTTYFNTVFAKATSAQYADLAEKYTADAEYAPGTVVVFGGTHEVTVDAVDADRKVAGVVSTNPSYIMNGGLEAEHVATVALTGRVPTLVVGIVRKGDLMVAAGLGRARAESNPQIGSVIGKALEDFNGVEGTIEVVVGRF